MFCPNILANGHANFFPMYLNRLDAAGRLEITVLVEDIVSGQKRFVSFADRLASLEQSSGVAKWFAASIVAIDKPDQQRRRAHAGVQFFEQGEILGNEARLENEILRRI